MINGCRIAARRVMIVSPRHKYVFIENHRTASTAVAKELVDLYDGESVLFKHAVYDLFVEWAGADADQYFVFAGVRNPMDEVVSKFFKLKSDHKGNFSNPAALRKNGGWLPDQVVREFEFVQRPGVDFAAYFRAFYTHPYVSPYVLVRNELDLTIRFEYIQEDFSALLRLIGVPQVRPLPVVNRTRKADRDFASFYTPDIRRQAIRVFGPAMSVSGYIFPPEWKASDIPVAHRAAFYAMYFAKKTYWKRAALARKRTHTNTYETVTAGAGSLS